MEEAIAPLVISASRATDIPSFHVPWLMNRLRAGHCRWRNPFNPRQIQLVSFGQCAALVFWSKNPAPLIPHLPEIAEMGFNFYFQFTLNDYGAEGLEPGLPELSQRLETFRGLASLLGRERMIWRFDPIILGGSLKVKSLLCRVESLARFLSPHARRLVFSFADFYAKTARNLGRAFPAARPAMETEKLRFAEGLAQMRDGLDPPLEIAACAENTDFSQFGILPSACIDAALLAQICPERPEFQKAVQKLARGKPPRDSGQRALCRCSPSKDIGRYNTCPHLCAYCYANQSPQAVARGMASASQDSESL